MSSPPLDPLSSFRHAPGKFQGFRKLPYPLFKQFSVGGYVLPTSGAVIAAASVCFPAYNVVAAFLLDHSPQFPQIQACSFHEFAGSDCLFWPPGLVCFQYFVDHSIPLSKWRGRVSALWLFPFPRPLCSGKMVLDNSPVLVCCPGRCRFLPYGGRFYLTSTV